jgi:hypothetical protein
MQVYLKLQKLVALKSPLLGGIDGPGVNCRVVLAFGCFTQPCRLQSVTVRMVCEKAVEEKRTANSK